MQKEKLQSLGFTYSQYELPHQAFNCLDDLTSKDVIIIHNQRELNLLILQSNSSVHFYLGFDEFDEIESNGIIPVNKSAGPNTIGLTARTIIIFKNLELTNQFLKNWFADADIHFFSLSQL